MLLYRFSHYALELINPTIPITINIGNAKEISPPATIMINITGRNTTVSKNFEIPQAALTPKMNNFPNTHNMHIENNNVNIVPLLPLSIYAKLIIIHSFLFFKSKL